MRTYAAAATDIGNHRENNEDAHFIDESLGLYIVCDGMGGHAAGEVASERAITFAVQFLVQHRETIEEAATTPTTAFQVIKLVEEAIRFANLRLRELTDAFYDLRGAGTTLTLLQIVGEQAIMGHVGDSRLYLKRGDKVHLLSTDHTMAHELMLDGTLAPEEAATSTYQHILTRNVGSESSVRVETLMFDILPDDMLILCSDGLSNYFDSNTDFDMLLSTGELTSIADGLIHFANSAGGKDNITAIVIRGEHDEISQQVAKPAKQLEALTFQSPSAR